MDLTCLAVLAGVMEKNLPTWLSDDSCIAGLVHVSLSGSVGAAPAYCVDAPDWLLAIGGI